ncbi:DNA glycosylase AlkZ-like family protein [Streptomyces canus]|uniref:DNA glycosylase AlkZ-like family protein n=1 Tax=Streptomyces canus TaxID=58343 RepID=UPI0036930ABC
MRAFVLGCQGLWPGRRWTGRDGLRAALTEMQAVQVDPLNVVARSHELALHSRVLGHELGALDVLLYTDREFFDYGGLVLITPMRELPFHRVAMDRRRHDRRWADFPAEHGQLLDRVREELAARGPLAARDLTGGAAKQTGSFRSARETSRALYYLWLTGELMTHSRRGFERVYALRDEVAPAAYGHRAEPGEADDYFARKSLAFLGLPTGRSWYGWYTQFSRSDEGRSAARARLARMLESGAVEPVTVEDSGELHYCLAEKLPLLETVGAGGVPDEWQPVRPRTTERAALLAPLDIVSARGRAAELFGFDFVWEVYKPAAVRRYGYYTLPVLHGHELVARLDPRLDRTSGTLQINGLWLEDRTPDEGLPAALAAALVDLGRLTGADRIALAGVPRTGIGGDLHRFIEAEGVPAAELPSSVGLQAADRPQAVCE